MKILRNRGRFPFDHIVDHETKQVWVICKSSTLALGIPTLINQTYPGYVGHIASDEYFDTLKSEVQF
jgi:hypothetical protein